jgi:signal peptidase I
MPEAAEKSASTLAESGTTVSAAVVEGPAIEEPVAEERPAERSEEPNVSLRSLIVFEPNSGVAIPQTHLADAVDLPLKGLVVFARTLHWQPAGFEAGTRNRSESFISPASVEEQPTTGLDHEPDVPLGALIVFEPAIVLASPSVDVGLGDLVRYENPSVEQLVANSPVLRRTVMREWAESLAMVVAFILVFTGYVAQATQVPTESMKPTIFVGDHFFIEKLAYPGNYPAAVRPFLPRRAIRHGDIVVFRSPVDGKIPFVKRVIGTPGDTVEIRQKEVFVNGVKLDEPYKIHMDASVYKEDGWSPEDNRKRDNYGPAVVPPDNFFVMGDNRDNSNDSRYWGYVGRDAIMGKPLFIYWSYQSEPYVNAPPTIRERFNDYLSTGAHFFSRTRWFRFGRLVQ